MKTKNKDNNNKEKNTGYHVQSPIPVVTPANKARETQARG